MSVTCVTGVPFKARRADALSGHIITHASVSAGPTRVHTSSSPQTSPAPFNNITSLLIFIRFFNLVTENHPALINILTFIFSETYIIQNQYYI